MWSHYHIVVIVIFIDVHFIIATYISYALASKSSQFFSLICAGSVQLVQIVVPSTTIRRGATEPEQVFGVVIIFRLCA